MKKVSIIFSFLAIFIFTYAQQNSTVKPAPKTTPVVSVDSKASTINAPVTNSAEPKACCAGKTKEQCGHDAKKCSKEGEGKACCQKGGNKQSCNHGATEKATEKKAE